jgi:hypothetical protein
MISSEVQRTIVKSPPELWAELSDPAALARHLGELGEIRITRVEPEQSVEWEADDTSGTVLINPSGWGTRVTLTVTRETPEAESPPTPDVLAEPDAAMLAEPEPIVEPDAESSASAEEEAEPAIAIDRESALETSAESGRPIQAGPDPQSEPDGVIAIDEAPAAEQEREPRQEQELRQEQEPRREQELQQEQEHEHELGDDFMPVLEPRRGFFARLFGRHRWIPQPSFESGEVGLQQSPEPADAFAAVTRALALETFAAAHPFIAAHLTAPTQAESVRIEEAAETKAPPAETWGEPHAWAELQAPAEAESPAQSDTQARQADDLSAETRAAEEEVAAEQVTAVLTSVLDRLGAAHHRPFSRA